MALHEILADYEELTLEQVVDELISADAISLEDDEKIGRITLECDADLEVEILKKVEGDPRCTGYFDHTETLTMFDIEYYLEDGYKYLWATNEELENVLLKIG